MGERLTGEQLKALDPEFWTDERVAMQLEQWDFKQPRDPKEFEKHMLKAQRWEDTMRDLNEQRRVGTISESDYERLAWEAADQCWEDNL